jgi:hypothetical protein
LRATRRRPQYRARQLFHGGGNTFGKVGMPSVQYTDYFFLDLKTAQAFIDNFGGFTKLAVGPESDRPI